MKRISILLILAVFMVTLLAPATVLAQSSQIRRCADVIWSGLWSGANLSFDVTDDCKTTTDSQQSSNTAQQNTPQTLARSDRYVALGDSVAAGLGLQPVKTGTNNDVCGVSAFAYPGYVAANLNRQYVNAACSGATAGDTFTEQHLSNTSRDIEPQLDTAFADGTPALITITAGANDVRWADFVRKCYASQCGATLDNTAVDGLLTALDFKLDYMLDEINRRSGNQPPRVIMTGYYYPLSAKCNTQTQAVTAAELTWLNGQFNRLNERIKQAVSEHSSFARYAPVNFAGHELCGNDSWVQGPNDPAPFHPTNRGQQAIASSVLAANK